MLLGCIDLTAKIGGDLERNIKEELGFGGLTYNKITKRVKYRIIVAQEEANPADPYWPDQSLKVLLESFELLTYLNLQDHDPHFQSGLDPASKFAPTILCTYIFPGKPNVCESGVIYTRKFPQDVWIF